MVTEIIKQDDVDAHYLEINYWIRNGITEDAVDLYRHQWNDTPTHNYTHSYTVRNKNGYELDDDNPTYPANKW